MKNEKDRKDYYTDNNVSANLSVLKQRLIGFRDRYRSYLQPKKTGHMQISKSEKHKLLNPSENIQSCPHNSIQAKKRRTDDDSNNSQNSQTNITIGLEYKVNISRLREKLMETSHCKENEKKASVIELDFFLKKYIIFAAEPSSEIVADINIEKVMQFYKENEKYVKCGAHYFRRTVVLQKINYLFWGCIRTFLETRIASKCSLFPEFMTLNKFFSQFECYSKKITLFTRLSLIYVVDKFEILFTSCIHLRQEAENLKNTHIHPNIVLNRHFFIRQVLFPQLFYIFYAKSNFTTKYVFMAELEYNYIDSKCDDVTNTTFDMFENYYELLFFMSYNLFGRIKFSPEPSINYWDLITTVECLNDKTIVARIFKDHFDHIKEYYKGSVKDLYSYVENYLMVGSLPDMDDILRRLEELNGDVEKIMLGLFGIYKMIHEGFTS